MGQVIQIGYGKANLSVTLATFAAMRIQAPWKRDSAVNSGRKNPGQRPRTSSVGAYDLNGAIIMATVEHDPGTVLMLRASWSNRGAPTREGAIFLQLRPQAALIEVAAALPLGPDNVLGTHAAIFQGNADLMSIDDLLDLKIDPGQQFVNRYMDIEEVEECFAIRQLVAEVAQRPALETVYTAKGVTKAIVAEAPMRRMNFRRRK